LGAEPHYFLLDQKVTKNQASKEASLRSRPLRGKTDKTIPKLRDIILPLSLYPNAHGKKTLCPSRRTAQLVISFHPKLFCWRPLFTEPTFSYGQC